MRPVSGSLKLSTQRGGSDGNYQPPRRGRKLPQVQRPEQDSNLRPTLRRESLYPAELSGLAIWA